MLQTSCHLVYQLENIFVVVLLTEGNWLFLISFFFFWKYKFGNSTKKLNNIYFWDFGFGLPNIHTFTPRSLMKVCLYEKLCAFSFIYCQHSIHFSILNVILLPSFNNHIYINRQSYVCYLNLCRLFQTLHTP